MSISLCMIVKNEEYFLRDCLAAAAPHVDEIVVVDTGSSDRTRQIAAEFTDKLHRYDWHDDYAAARNASLAHASCDWILVLDADEQIEPADYRTLRELTRATTLDGFFLQQYNYTDDETAHGWHAATGSLSRGFSGYTTNPILRLFRRREDIHYSGRIHEVVDASIAPERRETLDIPIHHYVDANPERPRRERALKYLDLMEQELAEAPSARIYSIAASTAMYHAEDYTRARNYFIKAAELGYQRGYNLEGAAEACYRGGEPGMARDLYQSAWDEGYRSPSMCLNMANLAVKNGEKALGATLLEECLALGGLSPDINRVIQQNIELLTRR